jgi:SAM-dependent methyltransferase
MKGPGGHRGALAGQFTPRGRILWRGAADLAVLIGMSKWGGLGGAMADGVRKAGAAGRGTERRLLAEVAASVDAPRALLPVLAELFADLSSLGSTPRRVAGWLADAGVGRGMTVIDLGCGKGAAAVELAARTGAGVVGVDAFAPFIESARELAARRNVAERCRFEVADYRSAGRRRMRFDAGMMLGVAPVDRAAALLHRVVQRGGVYVIDDAVCATGEQGPDLEWARGVIEGLGDEVVREHVFRPSEVSRMEARLRQGLKGGAEALMRRRPALRETVQEYLAAQRRAAAALRGPLRPVLWMVQRGGD